MITKRELTLDEARLPCLQLRRAAYLSDLFDTAKDKGAHANPGDDQAYGEVGHQVSHRVHVTAHLQHLVVEEVIGWRRLQALGVCC